MTTQSVDLELYAFAEQAASTAYVPYCKFPVGAALRFDTGEVITGVNVDNASSPLTLCAERGAVSTAISRGLSKIVAVAVHGTSESVSPCGGCRQVLSEFASDDCTVTFRWNGELVGVPLSKLLPYSFDLRGTGW